MNSKKKKRDGNRIIELGRNCSYLQHSRFFIGKLVVLVESSGSGSSGWYRFVYDEDRKALNKAAGWSDSKEKYLLFNPKFKE